MKQLSYDTLHDIRDMLDKQITLWYFNKDKLQRLQNDKKIIEEEISKLLDKIFYGV